MIDRPEYVISELTCIGSLTGITFTIDGLFVNDTEYITTPLSSTTVTNGTLNLVQANNTIVSGCSGSAGWTYSNFTEFLNQTFQSLGLFNYTAILSLKEKQGIGNDCSKNGFYISYPKDDLFIITVKSSTDGFNLIITYTNSGILVENGNSSYYCSTTDDIDYDCLVNKVNEYYVYI